MRFLNTISNFKFVSGIDVGVRVARMLMCAYVCAGQQSTLDAILRNITYICLDKVSLQLK